MGYGHMTAVVTGTDALGESVSSTLNIIVRDGTKPVDVYPNPVTDTLFVRTGTGTECHISLTSTSGATVYEQSAVVTPFSPHAIDLITLPGGQYTVTVTANGTETTHRIMKL